MDRSTRQPPDRRQATRGVLLAIGVMLLLGTACGTSSGGAGASTRLSVPSVASGSGPIAVSPGPAPSPTPTMIDTVITGATFVDANRGWVIGRRCPSGRPATPAESSGCEGTVEHTDDGGRSWVEQSLGDARLVPRAVQFVDADHGWLAATTDASCGPGPCATVTYATGDGGRRWEANFHTGPNIPSMMVNGHPVMARSVSLTTLAMTSARAGWAFGTACTAAGEATCRPVLFATPDGGSFSQLALPPLPSSTRLSLAHPTAPDGWIAAGGRLVATHDGGRTWRDLPDPAPRDAWQQISFRSATEGWLLAGGEPGAGQQLKALYHTRDGGRTWDRVAGATLTAGAPGLPSSGYVGQLVFSTASDGWIASPRGGLLASADAGRTWRRLPRVSCGDLTCQTVGFAGPDVGWVASNRGLWLTSDGGRDWRPLAVPGVDATD